MDFARNERGFCVGFAWNLILFSFVREREGYKHHADCTVVQMFGSCKVFHESTSIIISAFHY